MCPVAMAMNYKEVMYDPFPPELYMNTIYVIIKLMHYLDLVVLFVQPQRGFIMCIQHNIHVCHTCTCTHSHQHYHEYAVLCNNAILVVLIL